MRKFIVEYAIPYSHVVQVGIEAETPEQATTEAGRLFDAGDIWDDTAKVPLIEDDYFEDCSAGQSLEFKVESEVERWPESSGTVQRWRKEQAGLVAAKLLVTAYQKANECGASVDWEDLDTAYEAALKVVNG